MLRYDKSGTVSHTVYIRVSGRKVPLLIVKPANCKPSATGVLWIHGGGYITGMKEMVYMGRSADLVRKFGVVVVSPGYHLAPLYKYPVALKECYAALAFMLKNADKLCINRDQIMVGGESAGGGLTAALTMLARDIGRINIAFQMPLYPMIDNFDTESSRDNHAKIWNTKTNHFGWRMYLGNRYNKRVPPYAAPAHQTDFSGLPSAYTFVSTAEPFYAETVQYVKDLKAAGVDVKLNIYEGMYHAFDMMEPEHETSKKAIADFDEYFKFAQETFFAHNDIK